jgi:hypothetical protein
MSSNKFEGQTLPFISRGWTRQIKSGTFRSGATWKHVEKVKVIGRGTMGSKLEDVHILASWDIDQGGNKTTNTRKEYYPMTALIVGLWKHRRRQKRSLKLLIGESG